MHTVKDPVCGMMIPVDEGLVVAYQGRGLRFCSDLCKRTYLATPERYASLLTGVVQDIVNAARHIAYFSMEVAADERPILKGGKRL